MVSLVHVQLLYGPARMRLAIISSAIVLGSLLTSAVTSAQSTISDRPFDIVAGSGIWGSFLPDYELGTNGGGTPTLRDSLDDPGYYGDIKVIRRFLGTRTSFEARGFYGYSGSESSNAVGNLDVPDPINGSSNLFSGGASSLSAETDHYGYDIGLRDTWRTRYGGLSGACYFSYMAFDQSFDVDYGPTRLMSEKLNSDYIGGKAVVGWDGCLMGNPSTLDFIVGFYQLRADYRYSGGAIPGNYATTLHKTPITLETVFSNYREFHGYQFGLTLAATYIAQMPVIEHNVGSPVSLGTDSGVLVRMMFEILL